MPVVARRHLEARKQQAIHAGRDETGLDGDRGVKSSVVDDRHRVAIELAVWVGEQMHRLPQQPFERRLVLRTSSRFVSAGCRVSAR